METEPEDPTFSHPSAASPGWMRWALQGTWAQIRLPQKKTLTEGEEGRVNQV